MRLPLVVKHPLKRLREAWSEDMKLPDKNGGFSASEAGEKLLKLDGSEFNDDTGHSVTWESFIGKLSSVFKSGNYKIDRENNGRVSQSVFEKRAYNVNNGILSLDQSLLPVSRVCNDCNVVYDFLIKQESIIEDTAYVLQSVLKTNIRIPLAEFEDDGVAKPGFLKNYCQFSSDVLENLETFYINDYLLYGYTKFDRAMSCG